MCGRFAISTEIDELITAVVADGGDFTDWRPGYNIAPTDSIPIVIRSARDGGDPVRRLEPARWSLVPSWSRSLKLHYPTFNARSDSIATRTLWKGPLKRHRALIPATGYYQWQISSDGQKVPYFVRHPAGELLVFAGLYSWWKNPDLPEDHPDLWILTATILTANAVDDLLHIHDRNPVPLPETWWDTWLDPNIHGDQALVDAAVQAALPVAAGLEVYEVAPLPFRADGPGLIEPAVCLQGTEDWLSTEQ